MARSNLLSHEPAENVGRVWMNQCYFHNITEISELKRALEECLTVGMIAVDTETTGLHNINDEIVGISFSSDNFIGYYVPVGHKIGKNIDDVEKAKDIFIEYLSKMDKILFFNGKFDNNMLTQFGIDVVNIDNYVEVQVPCFLYDCNNHTPSLKGSSKYILGLEMIEYMEAIGADKWSAAQKKKFLPTMDLIDPINTYVYACCDAIITFRLYNHLKGIIESWGMQNIMYLDNRTYYYTMLMERTPQPVGVDIIQDIRNELEEEFKKVKREIYEFRGREFNINSPVELSDAVSDLNVGLYERTDSGYISTSEEHLKQFKDHPFVKKLLIYRGIKKQREYISLYEMYKNPGDPHLENTDWHGHEDTFPYYLIRYNPVNIPSGRFSSKGRKKEITHFSPVNAQVAPKSGNTIADIILFNDKEKAIPNSYNIFDNIFIYEKDNEDTVDYSRFGGSLSLSNVEINRKRLNMRKIFKPYPGHIWLSADYKSQELVLPAYMSNEEIWIDAIKNNKDLHRITASAVFKKSPEEITKDERKKAKGLSFSLLYGGGSYSIANAFGIALDEAQELVDGFYGGLPNLSRWFDTQLQFARVHMYTNTLYGRRRYLPWLHDPNRKMQSYGERSVRSHNIQGTAADIMRMSIARYYNRIESNKDLEKDFILMSSIHDELNWSVNPDRLQEMIEYAHDIMIWKLHNISPDKLLKIDITIGPDWGTQIPLPEGLYDPEALNQKYIDGYF